MKGRGRWRRNRGGETADHTEDAARSGSRRRPGRAPAPIIAPMDKNQEIEAFIKRWQGVTATAQSCVIDPSRLFTPSPPGREAG